MYKLQARFSGYFLEPERCADKWGSNMATQVSSVDCRYPAVRVSEVGHCMLQFDILATDGHDGPGTSRSDPRIAFTRIGCNSMGSRSHDHPTPNDLKSSAVAARPQPRQMNNCAGSKTEGDNGRSSQRAHFKPSPRPPAGSFAPGIPPDPNSQMRHQS